MRDDGSPEGQPSLEGLGAGLDRALAGGPQFVEPGAAERSFKAAFQSLQAAGLASAAGGPESFERAMQSMRDRTEKMARDHGIEMPALAPHSMAALALSEGLVGQEQVQAGQEAAGQKAGRILMGMRTGALDALDAQALMREALGLERAKALISDSREAVAGWWEGRGLYEVAAEAEAEAEAVAAPAGGRLRRIKEAIFGAREPEPAAVAREQQRRWDCAMGAASAMAGAVDWSRRFEGELALARSGARSGGWIAQAAVGALIAARASAAGGLSVPQAALMNSVAREAEGLDRQAALAADMASLGWILCAKGQEASVAFEAARARRKPPARNLADMRAGLGPDGPLGDVWRIAPESGSGPGEVVHPTLGARETADKLREGADAVVDAAGRLRRFFASVVSDVKAWDMAECDASMLPEAKALGSFGTLAAAAALHAHRPVLGPHEELAREAIDRAKRSAARSGAPKV